MLTKGNINIDEALKSHDRKGTDVLEATKVLKILLRK